ncbi:unnamed protein product [Trichobilharzia regenti]|nr:unnamed protein product [Trichobilharzia regenti]
MIKDKELLRHSDRKSKWASPDRLADKSYHQCGVFYSMVKCQLKNHHRWSEISHDYQVSFPFQQKTCYILLKSFSNTIPCKFVILF